MHVRTQILNTNYNSQQEKSPINQALKHLFINMFYIIHIREILY